MSVPAFSVISNVLECDHIDQGDHNMISKKSLEEVVDKVVKTLPENLQRGPEQLRQRVEDVLLRGIARLDLVTREEFDAQTAVLKRCQAELAALSEKLDKKQPTDFA
jgi:ubiquinone biosynthesis accessory factor UbiK